MELFSAFSVSHMSQPSFLEGKAQEKLLTDRYSLVTERFGRKWTLQINVVVFIIGAVMMTAATHQLGLICTMTPAFHF